MKLQIAVGIGAMIITLGLRSARGEEGIGINIRGYNKEPIPETVTGAVARVSHINKGDPLPQLISTRMPIVIRGLVTETFSGPNMVARSGGWFLIIDGKVSEVLVGGVPVSLSSQVISNGLVRMRDFGDWWVYAYNGKAPCAIVGSGDQLRSLEEWVDADTNNAHADQNSGYSPSAAQPAHPTP